MLEFDIKNLKFSHKDIMCDHVNVVFSIEDLKGDYDNQYTMPFLYVKVEGFEIVTTHVYCALSDNESYTNLEFDSEKLSQLVLQHKQFIH